jgi:hypothetical protein
MRQLIPCTKHQLPILYRRKIICGWALGCMASRRSILLFKTTSQAGTNLFI